MQSSTFEMNIMNKNLTLLFKMYKWEIILGLCVLILAYVIVTVKKPGRTYFPPGPMGWPLVGYLLFFKRNPHLHFMQLGRKYGDVFSLKLGSEDIVVLHGADATIEAFNRPEFLGRPSNSKCLRLNPSSALFGNIFPIWKEQRKFLIQSLKILGFGTTKIEEIVTDEVGHFLDILRSSKTQPIDIEKHLSFSTSNTICSLAFGKRFEYDDFRCHYLEETLKETWKWFGYFSLDMLFPWIPYIPFAGKFLQCYKSMVAFKKLYVFFLKEIEDHLKNNHHADKRDYIDLFTEEMDKQKLKKPQDTSFNKKMLILNVMDLFFTGTETVDASLLWFIYIIAAFPDVQKNVQNEIMDVIGPDKTPEYMDMGNMPYTRAVMLEMIRWKFIAPLNFVHCTLADTTLGGYKIQKGTTVIANLWAIHHDPRNWDEPEKFNPKRFLTNDGKSVVKPSNFLPFLVGRRSCAGKSLANIEMFLFFTSILREFDIIFPDDMKPNFNGKLFLSFRPEPYFVRFMPKKLTF